MKFNHRIHVSASLMLLLFAAAMPDAAHAAVKKIIRVPVPVKSEADLGFVGVSRAGLLATYKRIGLLSAQLPPGFLSRDDSRRAIEAAVTKRLQLAGFEVVPSDSFTADFTKAERNAGGFYDSKTGELNVALKKAAFDIARRDFVAREQLAAYVTLEVVLHSATYFQYSFDCHWDNVPDNCFGSVTGLAPDEKWLPPLEGDGSVGAYSLQMSICTGEKALFVRSGGIQPAAYVGTVKRSRYVFPEVSQADALRDTARIERAAQVVVLPLLLSPLQIAQRDRDPEVNAYNIKLASLPALPAAPLPKPAPSFKTSRDEVLKSVHRVALSETGTPGLHVPNEVREHFRDLIRAELAPLGWQIVSAPEANARLSRLMPDAGIYDPFSGARDEARVAEVLRAASHSLELEPTPDAVLWVDVVPRTVVYQDGDVRWDGAEQSAITLGPIDWSFLGRRSSAPIGGGPIRAASLAVRLTDADGRTLYGSVAGIQVLQKISARGVAQYLHFSIFDLPPSDLFQDPARQQSAVHLALRSLVLRPEALEAELHPPVEKPPN
jgi:hypothetical protein